MIPYQARCVLPRLRCNGLSLLLNSYFLQSTEWTVLGIEPEVIRPRTSLNSYGTVLLRTLCTARSLVTPFLSTNCVPGLREMLDSGVPQSPAMPPSFGRGQITKTTATTGKDKSKHCFIKFNVLVFLWVICSEASPFLKKFCR